MRRVIGYLEPEEFRRYQGNGAKTQVVLSGHPGLNFEEACAIVEEDWRIFRELRDKYREVYALDEDDVLDISYFDGAITEGEE